MLHANGAIRNFPPNVIVDYKERLIVSCRCPRHEPLSSSFAYNGYLIMKLRSFVAALIIIEFGTVFKFKIKKKKNTEEKNIENR